MPIQAKLILWLLSVAVVLGVLFGAYHYGRHVQGLEDNELRNAAVIEQQTKNQAALLAYTEKIQTAGEQHDKNQTIISSLHDELNRVHVHIPTCAVSNPAETSADSGGGAGILSNAVDESFARLQDGVGELTKRCDQLNIDAIRINAEMK